MITVKRFEFLLLFLIVFVAAFLRFYGLSGYMTFLGDEGRDVIIIKKILVEHDLPFIGPPTSVGTIYLGPLYYYMMAASMSIFWLNPVAAAGMVASIGVGTVVLIYYLAKQWFGVAAASVASLLYAISPVTIAYSKSSWNPNPAPFFAALAILGIYQAHKSGNFRWLVLTGGALAFAVQMHYLALILVPIMGILWIRELFFRVKGYRYFIQGTLLAVIVFWMLMSPLVLFDLRHNMLNLRGVVSLFTGSDTVKVGNIETFKRIPSIYIEKLTGRYIGAENNLATMGISLAVLVPLAWALYKRRQKVMVPWAYFTLGCWLIVGLVGVSFYKDEIYDHYLGFLNPVPFLLLGSSVNFFRGRAKMLVAGGVILALVWLNLPKNPLLAPPNNQLERTQKIAKFVIEQSENKPFNFALIAERNYDAAYQFYLDIYGHKPKFLPVEITEQLFVVCEDAVCKPVGHPKYEIAAFGMTKIEKVSEVLGVKVYKLIANPDGKPS